MIEDGVFHDNLSTNSIAFIDHIPGDFNSVNKAFKISTIPSVGLDTDKTNDKHVTQTRPIEPTADQNCVQQLVVVYRARIALLTPMLNHFWLLNCAVSRD